MTTLDITITVKMSSDDNRIKVTPELISELLEDLKEDYVDTDMLNTSIDITEKVTNQHIVYQSKSG